MSALVKLMDKWLGIEDTDEIIKDWVLPESRTSRPPKELQKKFKEEPAFSDGYVIYWTKYLLPEAVEIEIETRSFYEVIKEEREKEKIKEPFIPERIDWNKVRLKQKDSYYPNQLTGPRAYRSRSRILTAY